MTSSPKPEQGTPRAIIVVAVLAFVVAAGWAGLRWKQSSAASRVPAPAPASSAPANEGQHSFPTNGSTSPANPGTPADKKGEILEG